MKSWKNFANWVKSGTPEVEQCKDAPPSSSALTSSPVLGRSEKWTTSLSSEEIQREVGAQIALDFLVTCYLSPPWPKEGLLRISFHCLGQWQIHQPWLGHMHPQLCKTPWPLQLGVCPQRTSEPWAGWDGMGWDWIGLDWIGWVMGSCEKVSKHHLLDYKISSQNDLGLGILLLVWEG